MSSPGFFAVGDAWLHAAIAPHTPAAGTKNTQSCLARPRHAVVIGLERSTIAAGATFSAPMNSEGPI
jgi:hypothetical protein